jgi:excisionase family DNA binding protein
MNESTAIENYLSPTAAGLVLGLSRDRVRQLVQAGQIHGLRTANGYLIPPEEVVRFKAERRRRKAQSA